MANGVGMDKGIVSFLNDILFGDTKPTAANDPLGGAVALGSFAATIGAFQMGAEIGGNGTGAVAINSPDFAAGPAPLPAATYGSSSPAMLKA